MKNLIGWVKKLPSRAVDTRDLYMGRLTVGKAELGAKLIKANGEVVDLGIVSRKKVTGAFVTFVVAQMVTDTTEIGDFKYHDAGTGTTAEANTQTALVTPWGGSRVAGTQVAAGTATAPTYTSVATISFNNTFAITEHAVFSQAAAATMLDRSVFSAINVINGDSIQFSYVMTMNAEA